MRLSSSQLLLGRRLRILALTALMMGPTVGLPQNKKSKTATPRSLTYPRTRAAISSLEAAKAELLKAQGDFGGHKKDALESIDSALKQMRLALQFEKY